MADHEPSVRRGAHRPPPEPRRALLLAATAAGVVALGVAGYALQPDPPAGASGPVALSTPIPQPVATPATTPVPTPSTPAAPTTAPTTAAPAAPPTATRTPATRTPATREPTRLPVLVLDDTSRGSAGDRVALVLNAQGWEVKDVAPFRGTISATTVYYPRGGRAAARDVAEALPGGARVLPRPAAVPDGLITVALASDFRP